VAVLRARWRGELARLPEGDEVCKAVEQADEGGQDEGVQRREGPGLGGVEVGRCPQVGGDAGDAGGQG